MGLKIYPLYCAINVVTTYFTQQNNINYLTISTMYGTVLKNVTE